MRARSNWVRFLGFLCFGALLRFFTTKAPTPEQSQDLWFALPAFGVFALFVLGITSWGAWIRSRSGFSLSSAPEDALFDLSAGTVLAYIGAYFLTPLHLFSSQFGAILWVLLALGFALGARHLRFQSCIDFGHAWYGRIFAGLIPLMVVVKLLEGLQFHQHGDAYVTYLPGPRMWAESGSFNGFLRYSSLFLSTSWESLFAWGTALMGLQGGSGLDLSQWFSQWVTGGIGLAGSLLAGLALARRMTDRFPVSVNWHPVIALASVQIGVLAWTQNLAKNDTGILFWGMAAFYFSVCALQTAPRAAWLAGALLGAAVVGKFTLVIFGVLLTLNVLFRNRPVFFQYALGGLAGSFPVFIRNFSLTGNPVYPWLPGVFPSKVANEFVEHGATAALSQGFHLADLPTYYGELADSVPLLWALPLMFVFNKNRAELFRLLWVPLLAYVGFTLVMRPSTNFRYQNAALVLIHGFSIYFSFYLVSRLFERLQQRVVAMASFVLALVLLAQSNLTLFTLLQIGNSKKFAPFSRRMVETEQIGGPAKVWIRSNLKPSDSILSFGDVHIYYLLDYQLTEVGQSVEYGRRVFGREPHEAAKVFESAPFDYLYISSEDFGAQDVFKDLSKALLEQVGFWNQKCKVFDNSKAQIWDLKCLNKLTT